MNKIKKIFNFIVQKLQESQKAEQLRLCQQAEQLKSQQIQLGLSYLQRLLREVMKNAPDFWNLEKNLSDFSIHTEFHEAEHVASACIPKKNSEKISNAIFFTRYQPNLLAIINDIKYAGKQKFIETQRVFNCQQLKIATSVLDDIHRQSQIAELYQRQQSYRLKNEWMLVDWSFIEFDDSDLELSLFFHCNGIDWSFLQNV